MVTASTGSPAMMTAWARPTPVVAIARERQDLRDVQRARSASAVANIRQGSEIVQANYKVPHIALRDREER
jgi:hypothetical protein